MQLRPYQSHALSAAWQYLRERPGNPALVLPTGAGKSPLMAALAREAVENWRGRVAIIAHTQELVRQNHAKLKQLWPEAPAGIYAAGLKRRDRFDAIIVGQIQSLANRAHEFGPFNLLLIDEAHRIPLAGEGRYLQFINDCRRWSPDLRVIGLTATPFRLQGRAVPVCGPEHVLTDVAYEARIGDLIGEGYLSPLISYAGERPDLSGVHTRGGEYVEAELAAAMDRADLVERTVADLCERAADRRAWIVFCVNVAHAEHVRAALVARGVAAGLVHGGTPAGERAAAVEAFLRGDLRAMVNVNVLSEGFDAPHIDCVAMLRPTKSPGLYYQQVGRGFRMAPGKADCLVLDYAGNVLEHGPVDAIKVAPARRGAAAEVRTGQAKECPACSAILPLGARVCECGHSFASADPAHFDRPIDAPILEATRPRVVNRFAVNSQKFNTHAKPGKRPSMRASYQCGLRTFREWICVEHTGTALMKAHAWWQRRAPGAAVPRTADAAVAAAYGLPCPVWIEVDETNKYPEVIAYGFAHEMGAGAIGDEREAGVANAGSPASPDALRELRDVPGWLLPAVAASRAA